MTEIFVNCKPIGKARPRFMSMGGRIHTYTPKATKDMEKLIADEYIAQGGKHYGDKMVIVNITCSFLPPKSTPKKKKKELLEKMFYKKKPDVDNLAKLVLDAINGVAYDDDSQVVILHTSKVYVEEEYQQSYHIIVKEIKGGYYEQV